MLCPFCKKANKDKKYVKAWNTKIYEHLIVTLSKDSRDGKVLWHLHGPINNTKLMEGILKVIAHESRIAIQIIQPKVEEPKVIEEPKNEAEAKTE